ncbi:hypothetical protein LDC_1625 [sediment metagenome]|uniref:Uncharacterized protein n=1 Tax=sediment metagenome TaxID=749907 RepID=D9PJB6_9ZZZZ
MEKIRESFLKAYSNLPEKVREEIIVVVNNTPFTWSSAYFEIKNNTSIGKEILNTLKELEIL